MVEVGRNDVWCGDLLAVLSVECFLFLLRFYQCYEATIQCFRCIKGTLEKDYAQEVYCCSLDVKLLFRFVSPFRCTWLLFSRTKVIDMDSRVFYMKSCERHQGVGDTIN